MEIENFGTRVRRLRKLNGMTQDTLARKAGYKGKAAISRIEKGINRVPLKSVDNLAKALGTSSDYLLGIENTTENRAGMDCRQVPILGYSNAAASTYMPEADFALIATGNEADGIQPGDIVTFKKPQNLHFGNVVACLENGRLVIAAYNGQKNIVGKGVSVERRL